MCTRAARRQILLLLSVVIVIVVSIVVIELCYIGDNHEFVIIVDSECVHLLEENRYLSF